MAKHAFLLFALFTLPSTFIIYGDTTLPVSRVYIIYHILDYVFCLTRTDSKAYSSLHNCRSSSSPIQQKPTAYPDYSASSQGSYGCKTPEAVRDRGLTSDSSLWGHAWLAGAGIESVHFSQCYRWCQKKIHPRSAAELRRKSPVTAAEHLRPVSSPRRPGTRASYHSTGALRHRSRDSRFARTLRTAETETRLKFEKE